MLVVICIYLKLPHLSERKGVYNSLGVIYRDIFQETDVVEQLEVARIQVTLEETVIKMISSFNLCLPTDL